MSQHWNLYDAVRSFTPEIFQALVLRAHDKSSWLCVIGRGIVCIRLQCGRINMDAMVFTPLQDILRATTSKLR